MKIEAKKIEDGSKFWKRFDVTNYQSLMRYCIFVNVCLGLLHCKIESWRFVSSKSRLSFAMILVAVYGTFWFVATYNFIFINIFYELSFVLHCAMILILSPLIVFSGYASNRTNAQTMQKVEDLTRRLPPRTFRKLAKLIYSKDTIQLIPFIVFLPSIWQGVEAAITCVSWYTFLTAIAANTFYVNNICVLKACFERINDSLTKMNETLTNEEPRLFRRVYHSRNDSSLLVELEILKRQHLRVSKVVRLINETYGLQNMGTLVLFFIDITFNVYHYVALINEHDMANDKNIVQINIFLVYYILSLILTVWTIETTKDQEQNIGLNIHRIVAKTFDEQIMIELQLFSLQVLQCNNTYLALGLPMDATLLTKLACSIATYVLILIQFLLIKAC